MSPLDLDLLRREIQRSRGDAFVRVNAPSLIALNQLEVQVEILEQLRAMREVLEGMALDLQLMPENVGPAAPPVIEVVLPAPKAEVVVPPAYVHCPECGRKGGTPHKATCKRGKGEASLLTPTKAPLG